MLGNTWTILYVSIKFWPVLATKRLLLNGIFVIWALLDPLWACFAILRTFWAQVQNITGYPQRPKLPKYPFVPKSSQTWKNSKMKFSCDTLYVSFARVSEGGGYTLRLHAEDGGTLPREATLTY